MTPTHPRRNDRRRSVAAPVTLLAALLVLGALSYSAWLLEPFLGTGLDPVESYVSELAATDQPLSGFFRAADLVAGALLLTAALLAVALPAVRTLERRFWSVTGWVALAVFGAATVADSRLPLSCAPTADAACAAREDAGLVPATHAAHAVSSSLAMAGAVTAVVALTVAARRYGRWRPLARTGPALVALELAATAWTLAAVTAFEAERGHWALGAAQRAQLLLLAIWLLVLAWSLARGAFGPRQGRSGRSDVSGEDERRPGVAGRGEEARG
ncbi:DUF998 domain-containing protein [Streptomyces sp. TRM64462]|uniref:DUF998 domain-containing protein n=1 Tax=Streptomyces sp. TRM64462 TaxID=2741726 RepID=UPI001585E575|nr:DUF998 domain-containing protein [Streptomyces sp. TRM64462]